MTCFRDILPPTELSIFTAIISVIISVVTILGNGLILLIIIKDPLKKLHTPFNYFLVNLAVSDLIVGTLTMPVSAVYHSKESTEVLDKQLSKPLLIITSVSFGSSLLSFIALSVDRYIAITWAFKYRQYLNWNRCKLVIVGIWIISLSSPFLYFEFGYINYLMFYACSAILTSLIVLLGIYGSIYLFLRKQTTSIERTLQFVSRAICTRAQNFHLKRLAMDKKVTRTFLVILFVFISTYIPALVMIFILQFCKTCDCIMLHTLRDLQFLLITANSGVNPFICIIRLKDFGKSIKTIFKKSAISPYVQSQQTTS